MTLSDICQQSAMTWNPSRGHLDVSSHSLCGGATVRYPDGQMAKLRRTIYMIAIVLDGQYGIVWEEHGISKLFFHTIPPKWHCRFHLGDYCNFAMWNPRLLTLHIFAQCPYRKESVTPPGPRKCVVLSFLIFFVLFPHIWSYERSKFLGDVLFLVCYSLALFLAACFL